MNHVIATVVMETIYKMSQDPCEAISKAATELLQALLMEALKVLGQGNAHR